MTPEIPKSVLRVPTLLPRKVPLSEAVNPQVGLLEEFVGEGLARFNDPVHGDENRDRTLLVLAYQLQQLNAALAPLLAMIANPDLMKNAGRLAGLMGGR